MASRDPVVEHMPAAADMDELENSTDSRQANRSRTVFSLLAPSLAGLLVTFVLPVFWVVRMSLNNVGSDYQMLGGISLGTYAETLSSSSTWSVIWQTIEFGTIVAVATTAISYPMALFLVRTTSRWRGTLIALAIGPLLTSSVALTFGWIAILGRDGALNAILTRLGVIDQPLQLINNYLGAGIALVQIMMPYAVLVMMPGFGRVERSFEDAARSLGASALITFWRVTLPLSAPGILAAGLLVFVLSISAFVTPRLMGGGRVFLLSTEIYNEATQTLNWPLASALSMILLILFGVFILVYQRVAKAVSR